MTSSKAKPEYRWGQIIQVPPAAFCRGGLAPAYGRFYGVIISSIRFWYSHRSHEEVQNASRSEEERRQPKGQYVVALISKEPQHPELETLIRDDGRFKGWYITAGLFVSVMDSQMESIPATDRVWGYLSNRDCKTLQSNLKNLFENDRRQPLPKESGTNRGGFLRGLFGKRE